MAFLNKARLAGLLADTSARDSTVNVDAQPPGFERGVLVPFPTDPALTWIYYECTVTCRLDSGIVVHNRLPQVDNAPDTLGSCAYDDPKLAEVVAGVNLKSRDQYEDVVQRMAHSRYWFRLHGQALRLGIKVPIPRLVTIGGVPAVPHDEQPQVAFNRVAPGGNYGGAILWHAYWSLWYTTAKPPRGDAIPAANPYAGVAGDEKAPDGVQTPFSEPDDNAVKAAPPANVARPVP